MAIVYYSAATGRVRRVISNSLGESRSDLALALVHKGGNGELFLRVADPVDLGTIQDVISEASGLVPENDRYVGVSKRDGVVGPCILADPACGDSIAGYTLVAHADAKMGWRQLRDGSFQRSLPEINKDITANDRLLTILVKEQWIQVASHVRGLTVAQIDAKFSELRAKAEEKQTDLANEKAAREATL